MPAQPIAMAIAEETFEDYEPMLKSQYISFMKRCPFLDPDEVWSNVLWAFLEACQQWDKNRGVPFVGFLGMKTKWSFASLRKKALSKKNRQPAQDISDIPDNYHPAAFPPRDFQETWEVFSEDARLVASLVLLTPSDVQGKIKQKGGQKRNVLSSIRDYLVEAGWASSRVTKAFVEIASMV